MYEVKNVVQERRRAMLPGGEEQFFRYLTYERSKISRRRNDHVNGCRLALGILFDPERRKYDRPRVAQGLFEFGLMSADEDLFYISFDAERLAEQKESAHAERFDIAVTEVMLDQFFANALVEIQEDELADLFETRRWEFEKRWRAGRESLVGKRDEA